MPNSCTTTFRLGPHELRLLERLSKEMGCSRSDVIRWALDELRAERVRKAERDRRFDRHRFVVYTAGVSVVVKCQRTEKGDAEVTFTDACGHEVRAVGADHGRWIDNFVRLNYHRTPKPFFVADARREFDQTIGPLSGAALVSGHPPAK